MIETEEVQGNVLRSYGSAFPYARYLLYRLRPGDTDDAAATISGWLGMATFGRDAGSSSPRVGIAFTAEGLAQIGVDAETIRRFPEEFRDGAHKRAVANGDDNRGDWAAVFRDPHVLLTVHARSRDELRDFVGRHRLSDPRGLEWPHQVAAGDAQLAKGSGGSPRSCNAAGTRERFGFRDGCSQPAIEGLDPDPTGDGVYAALPSRAPARLRTADQVARDMGLLRTSRRWRGVRAGEFVLGYENEEGVLPEGPPAPLGPNGTFMVYRLIRQHPDRFHEYANRQGEELARRTGDDRWTQQLVEAKIVGRWPDGTPLTLSPDRPDADISDHARRANDFLYHAERDGYRGDREGYGCPLGAHIRRVNPRDALAGGGERSMRHRIIRRGMPYGEPRSDCGLAFVCYGASIADGFEFIQRNWCMGGDAIGLAGQTDMLIAPQGRLTGMTVPAPDGGTVFLPAPSEAFTTVVGCAYLFVPSRSACEWLRKRL